VGNLIYAGEFEHNDGPWNIGDDERKFDGVVRYSRGTPLAGFSITGMAYHNQWRATDQCRTARSPKGGSAATARSTPTGRGQHGAVRTQRRLALVRHPFLCRIADVYAEHYNLDLFSNFHYFLFDPVQGDQSRATRQPVGLRRSGDHTIFGTLFGVQPRTPSGFRPAMTTSRTACITRRHRSG